MKNSRKPSSYINLPHLSAGGIQMEARKNSECPIYLCSPYSNADPAVQEERFEAACRAAAVLMQRGHLILSPICHSHPIAKHGLPTDWIFWEKYDRAILRRCEEVWVLMLPGWESSKGVQAEIKIARELGMAVEFIDPCNVITETTPDNAGAVEEVTV